MIKILLEKKKQIKENLERLKTQIEERKKLLSSDQTKLQKEKTQEKNSQIMMYNIRKQTFSLVLEYMFFKSGK
jgi:phage shock protein A